MNKQNLAIMMAILIIGLLARAYTLQYGSLQEPDDYVMLSVATQTVANNFQITSLLSGFPAHNPFGEQPGLIMLLIFGSYIFGSIYNSFLFLPVISGLLGIIGIYLLTKIITGNPKTGLVAAFLYATIPAAIFKSVAGEYRGETIIATVLIFSLIALLTIFKKYKDGNEIEESFGMAFFRYFYIAPSLIGLLALLVIAISVWNGGVLVPLVVFSIVGLLVLRQVLKKDYKTLVVGKILIFVAFLCLFTYSAQVSHLLNIPLPNLNSASVAIGEGQGVTYQFILYSFTWAIIFIPFGVFALDKMLKRDPDAHSVVYLVFILFVITLLLQSVETRFNTFLAIPVVILIAIGAFELGDFLAKHLFAFLRFVIPILACTSIIILPQTLATYYPADNINGQFLNATLWLANNTPTNSTVLSLWPDGSVIEGVGQRQSHSDSMQGGIDLAFQRALYQPPSNVSYISLIRPNYILVRHFWIYETASIKQSIGINQSRTLKGTLLQALLNKSVGYPIVFSNNDTIIYKVISD